MKTTTLSLLATLFMLSSCNSFRNYNEKSNQRIVSEKTTLTITPVKARTETPQVAGLVTAISTIGPTLIDLGVKSIQQKLKADALKYTGTYKASNSAQNFRLTEKDIQLPKLNVKKEILLLNDLSNPVNAVDFDLIPIPSDDQTAFRYKLDNTTFKYLYSTAKLKGAYIYIDLTIDIKIKSLSVVSGEYKLNDIRSVTMTIPKVKVGSPSISDEIYSGWIPMLPKSSIDTEVKVDVEDYKVTTKTDASNKSTTTSEKIITKDIVKKKANQVNINTGLYEIEVIVTEINPAKINAEQRAAFAEATSESGTAALKALIDVLTKKKEE